MYWLGNGSLLILPKEPTDMKRIATRAKKIRLNLIVAKFKDNF